MQKTQQRRVQGRIALGLLQRADADLYHVLSTHIVGQPNESRHSSRKYSTQQAPGG